MWRPTGTQLGKKKTTKEVNKTKTDANITKKKPLRRKKGERDPANNGTPAEEARQSNEQLPFHFEDQDALRCTEMHQATPQPNIPSTVNQFNGDMSMVPQPQNVYSNPVPMIEMVQNWPLDLVQNNHHFPQVVFLLQITSCKELKNVTMHLFFCRIKGLCLILGNIRCNTY